MGRWENVTTGKEPNKKHGLGKALNDFFLAYFLVKTNLCGDYTFL
jgi:hypothetical protein